MLPGPRQRGLTILQTCSFKWELRKESKMYRPTPTRFPTNILYTPMAEMHIIIITWLLLLVSRNKFIVQWNASQYCKPAHRKVNLHGKMGADLLLHLFSRPVWGNLVEGVHQLFIHLLFSRSYVQEAAVNGPLFETRWNKGKSESVTQRIESIPTCRASRDSIADRAQSSPVDRQPNGSCCGFAPATGNLIGPAFLQGAAAVF